MSSRDSENSAKPVPLILDVDGTLLRTDMLYECFWSALSQNVSATLGTTLRHLRQPARLKHELAAIASLSVSHLPVREPVLELGRTAQAEGVPVHLVSGSDHALVNELGEELRFTGPHFGSRPDRNLTRDVKAEFLTDRFGAEGFDYVGNGDADVPVWRCARRLILVEPSAALLSQVRSFGKPIEIVDDPTETGALLRELRPRQWVKNVLLFLPLLASHQFDPAAFMNVALAAVAFSLGASSIYILNDLLDLDADRRHPEKQNRPLAEGSLTIRDGMIASVALACLSLSLALAVGPPVAGLTLLYMAGSLSYSLWFKRRRWLDVTVLACLFMLRVVTGAVAVGMIVPPLLLALGFIVFFVLACVKRVTALSRMSMRSHLPGRGYTQADLATLQRAAQSGIILSAVLYLLYSFSPEARTLYSNVPLLALAGVPMVIWLRRMVRLSALGQEDYDPVRFVLHDRTGWAIILVGFLLVGLAV